ncbi:MAG: citryl-CoA lyase [Acidobacteria bacterium]|nr:citryl-CoA lyase [Acidobacteriota bacterium]
MPSDRWQTALTDIAPNRILIRGFPVDELMGRLSFAEAVYLLLMGELPSPAIGRMLNAVLVSSIDHGVTPPSTLAARNVATTGAPLKDSVAAGVLAFGPHHGGDIESCMRFLDSGLSLMRDGRTQQEAAVAVVDSLLRQPGAPPGFGHRFHTRDPRAARLLQMALELELEGEHVRLLRGIEHAMAERAAEFGRALPVNVDGAIAAVCADLGFAYELGNAIFLISRLPGLIAHAHEERTRQAPMRQIDPKDHDYDGARERRLPEGRK